MRPRMAGEIGQVEDRREDPRGGNVNGRIAIRQGRRSAQSPHPIEGANAWRCDMEPETCGMASDFASFGNSGYFLEGPVRYIARNVLG